MDRGNKGRRMMGSESGGGMRWRVGDEGEGKARLSLFVTVISRVGDGLKSHSGASCSPSRQPDGGSAKHEPSAAAGELA